jgi:hypothetical protein
MVIVLPARPSGSSAMGFIVIEKDKEERNAEQVPENNVRKEKRKKSPEERCSFHALTKLMFALPCRDLWSARQNRP